MMRGDEMSGGATVNLRPRRTCLEELPGSES